MGPDRIASTIAEFVASCRAPALLERGEAPLALEESRFRVEVTPKGTWLEAWDEQRVWSRRILRVASRTGKKLELEAFRFGKKNLPVSLIDSADARSAPALDKTRRSAFSEQFRLFLNRHYGAWRWEAFRSEAKLEHSFSPVFPTALLTRGNQAVAALGAPARDTGFHALTFALVWLDWVRREHGERAAARLLLYLPEAHAGAVIPLARQLAPGRLVIDIWLYDGEGQERLLDPADCGNLSSTLCPRYSRLGGPAWWLEYLERQPLLDCLEEPDGAISYRLRGLELARLSAAGGGNCLPALSWGLGRRRTARSEGLAGFEALFREVAATRQAAPAERTHPQYLAEPERWLESQVRRHLAEIDPGLDAACLYGQSIGVMGRHRTSLDLLGIGYDGRLAILELKASEDIHLPLQAFDYWLRVRQHLARGEFGASGYFPGREISRQDPELFLVSPSLHFHPMTQVVTGYLPPSCPIRQIGVNAQWRERLDVVLRR
ncbi:MAG: hypothetical protein K7J46_08115 [Bryobacter sp.]|jgi:hypothetical protein|nr:hypothetical protein [Bryobacter sp. CoA8 C33]